MSQRRRLLNSLRWRAVGWMEMGLSQADAARRLNVSRSIVQRLWDQYQSENSVPEDLFQADHELQHLQKTVGSFGTKEKNHYCAAARCRPLSSIRKKNLYYGAKSSSQCREQRTRYHQSNTVERQKKKGISLGGHTDLHVFGGTVTGLRYRDPYVRPYAAAIGNDFILMDDNARPHRARIVEEYLEDHGLERMEWPAISKPESDRTIILAEVAALNPLQRSFELKQCVWSFPIHPTT
ncbi:uncharacterized protein TNCV_4776301 [Trichonephila clavipes]|nr:uncharacterized protein TNCV_4776301 [Trichonephila clavipes]